MTREGRVSEQPLSAILLDCKKGKMLAALSLILMLKAVIAGKNKCQNIIIKIKITITSVSGLHLLLKSSTGVYSKQASRHAVSTARAQQTSRPIGSP